MQEQTYTLIITNDHYKYLQTFKIVFVLVNLIAICVASAKLVPGNSYAYFSFSAIAAWLLLMQGRQQRLHKFYIDVIVETCIALVWITLKLYWVAGLVLLVTLLQFGNRQRFVFNFSAARIIVTAPFHKKTISWKQLQNVVLKDGLLTMDYKNNKLLQAEISFAETINETTFNEFCKTSIEAHR